MREILSVSCLVIVACHDEVLLTPVAPGDGHLGNVRLLEVVLLASERDEVGGAIGDVDGLNLRRHIRGRSRRHGAGVVVE